MAPRSTFPILKAGAAGTRGYGKQHCYNVNVVAALLLIVCVTQVRRQASHGLMNTVLGWDRVQQ